MLNKIKQFFAGRPQQLTESDFDELVDKTAAEETHDIKGLKVKKSDNEGIYAAFYDTPYSIINVAGQHPKIMNDRIVLQHSKNGKSVREDRFTDVKALFSHVLDLQINDRQFHGIHMDKKLREHFEEYTQNFITESTNEQSLEEILKTAIQANKEKAEIIADIKVSTI